MTSGPSLAMPEESVSSAKGEHATSNAQDATNAQDAGGAQASAQQATLRDYALAAVASRSGARRDAAEESTEILFLLQHLERVAAANEHWTKNLAGYLRQPALVDQPLLRLAKGLGLTLIELLAVRLAASVEDELMVGRALARLQAPVGGSRPTVGLLADAFSEVAPAGVRAIDALATGAGVQSGLLALMNEGAPLAERAVAVPLHLCLALNGYDGSLPGTTIGMGAAEPVALPPSVHAEAARRAQGLLASVRSALVVRSGSSAEARSVAALIADAMQRRPLFIETEKTVGLGPWLALRHLLPVFCFELSPGERKVLPPDAWYDGPVLVLCGPDGSVVSQGGTVTSWSLPVPHRDEREQLWRDALGSDELAHELAFYHRHSSGRIAHLARLTEYQRVLHAREEATREDVWAASWSGEGADLESLAQPLRNVIPDEALVTTPTLRDDLDTLLLRCRTRDRLAEGLGASATARYSPGVRALFVGPSGTGKTLAASWLASRLGLPLYRVDLASVTSKYIGETEKNLAQLLARAESSEVILLFDEADSLFGKRTDVKEANDRFANAQTNYLLQRIESFDGIALLTSNSRVRFDSSFSRRLDMIIDFPAPGPEERRSIWQTHLGESHSLTQKELNRLAATADLSGGNIRNVVFAAKVLTSREDDRQIEYGDVLQGLISEYRKLGKQLPAELKMNSLNL